MVSSDWRSTRLPYKVRDFLSIWNMGQYWYADTVDYDDVLMENTIKYIKQKNPDIEYVWYRSVEILDFVFNHNEITNFVAIDDMNLSKELGKKDGSDALLYVMLKYVREKSLNNLYNITYEEFKLMVKGNVEIPFIKERYETLSKTSKIVKEKMNGNFYKYIYSLHNDIELFQIIIKNFSSFKDEREYSSKYEVEIRASMIVVIDYIKNKIDNAKAIDINDYFFTVSKNEKLIAKPYHLCRNQNY